MPRFYPLNFTSNATLDGLSPSRKSTSPSPSKKKAFVSTVKKVETFGAPPPLPSLTASPDHTKIHDNELLDLETCYTILAETNFIAPSHFHLLQRQSIRWLNLSYTLWSLTVLDAFRTVNLGSISGFLDVISWRANGKINEDEFSALYSEWESKPDKDQSSSVKRIIVGVFSIRQLLLEMKYGETDLDLCIGIIVHEINMRLLNTSISYTSRKDNNLQNPYSLEVCSDRWLTLSEEIFFCLDTPGYGMLRFDEAFFFVACLTIGLQGWSDEEDLEADLSLATLTAATIQFMNDTGCNIMIRTRHQKEQHDYNRTKHHDPNLLNHHNNHHTVSVQDKSSHHKFNYLKQSHSRSAGETPSSSSSLSSSKLLQQQQQRRCSLSNNSKSEITLPMFKRYLLKHSVGESALTTMLSHVKGCIENVIRLAKISHAEKLYRSCKHYEDSSSGSSSGNNNGAASTMGSARLWQEAVLSASGHIARNNNNNTSLPPVILYLLSDAEPLLSGALRAIELPVDGKGFSSNNNDGDDTKSIITAITANEELHETVCNIWNLFRQWGMEDKSNSNRSSKSTTAAATALDTASAAGSYSSSNSVSDGGQQQQHRLMIKNSSHKLLSPGTSSNDVNDDIATMMIADIQRDPVYQLILMTVLQYKTLQNMLVAALYDMALSHFGVGNNTFNTATAIHSSGNKVVAPTPANFLVVICAGLVPNSQAVLLELGFQDEDNVADEVTEKGICEEETMLIESNDEDQRYLQHHYQLSYDNCNISSVADNLPCDRSTVALDYSNYNSNIDYRLQQQQQIQYDDDNNNETSGFPLHSLSNDTAATSIAATTTTAEGSVAIKHSNDYKKKNNIQQSQVRVGSHEQQQQSIGKGISNISIKSTVHDYSSQTGRRSVGSNTSIASNNSDNTSKREEGQAARKNSSNTNTDSSGSSKSMLGSNSRYNRRRIMTEHRKPDKEEKAYTYPGSVRTTTRHNNNNNGSSSDSDNEVYRVAAAANEHNNNNNNNSGSTTQKKKKILVADSVDYVDSDTGSGSSYISTSTHSISLFNNNSSRGRNLLKAHNYIAVEKEISLAQWSPIHSKNNHWADSEGDDNDDKYTKVTANSNSSSSDSKYIKPATMISTVPRSSTTGTVSPAGSVNSACTTNSSYIHSKNNTSNSNHIDKTDITTKKNSKDGYNDTTAAAVALSEEEANILSEMLNTTDSVVQSELIDRLKKLRQRKTATTVTAENTTTTGAAVNSISDRPGAKESMSAAAAHAGDINSKNSPKNQQQQQSLPAVTATTTASTGPTTIDELLQQGQGSGQYALMLRDILRRMNKNDSKLQLKSLEQVLQLGHDIASLDSQQQLQNLKQQQQQLQRQMKQINHQQQGGYYNNISNQLAIAAAAHVNSAKNNNNKLHQQQQLDNIKGNENIDISNSSSSSSSNKNKINREDYLNNNNHEKYLNSNNMNDFSNSDTIPFNSNHKPQHNEVQYQKNDQRGRPVPVVVRATLSQQQHQYNNSSSSSSNLNDSGRGVPRFTASSPSVETENVVVGGGGGSDYNSSSNTMLTLPGGPLSQAGLIKNVTSSNISGGNGNSGLSSLVMRNANNNSSSAGRNSTSTSSGSSRNIPGQTPDPFAKKIKKAFGHPI